MEAALRTSIRNMAGQEATANHPFSGRFNDALTQDAIEAH